MVIIRKDSKAIPFPRRITRWELERFWKKLQEDVLGCGEIMPKKSEFDRKFAFLSYDSFNEARKNYRMFRDSICRGEEYKLPEKYSKPSPLGARARFLESLGINLESYDREKLDHVRAQGFNINI